MEDNGSFLRWQSNTQAQLGYAIGLILSLTTASLGFAVVLLRRLLNPLECVTSVFVALSIVVLVASGAIAIVCTINRLCDFRQTTAIARDRETWQRANEPDIDGRLHDRRAETNKLGKRTWNLFWWQIGTFAFGVGMLVIGILLQFVYVLK
jgi:hypothetical protein